MNIFPPYLDRGSHGAAVVVLQLILLSISVKNRPLSRRVTLGEYDVDTADDVRVLQAQLGFRGSDVDGNFGPGTRAALKAQMGIDVDAMTTELFVGATYYRSPEGGGFWNHVQPRE